jgi:hypothetical protein
MASAAARWCFAAATCAVLGTILLLSGGDVASTSTMLRGAFHAGASASEEPRRLEDAAAEVDAEDDFFKGPVKEKSLSEEPLRKLQTQGSCEGCTSNEVQISEELFGCVAAHSGGCALIDFCHLKTNHGEPCCTTLANEFPDGTDWNCPQNREPQPTQAPDPQKGLYLWDPKQSAQRVFVQECKEDHTDCQKASLVRIPHDGFFGGAAWAIYPPDIDFFRGLTDQNTHTWVHIEFCEGKEGCWQ